MHLQHRSLALGADLVLQHTEASSATHLHSGTASSHILTGKLAVSSSLLGTQLLGFTSTKITTFCNQYDLESAL